MLSDFPITDNWLMDLGSTQERISALIENSKQKVGIGLALQQVAATYETVNIERDATGLVTVTGLTTTRPGPVSFSGDIYDALSLLMGLEEKKKQCVLCGAELPYRKFSHCKRSPDGTGRNQSCLVCERKRVKDYKDKVKATGGRIVRPKP